MTGPEPYWADGQITLYLGKCEQVLPLLPEASVDAIVTDPPAAIAFMGKTWDSNLGGRNQWVEWLTGVMAAAARCLKPGGHVLVWSLPRTSHWTAWAIESAGLEIRDCVLHLFGSGFPKSRDVSKAIDQEAGAERKVIGEGARFGRGAHQNRTRVEMGYRPGEVAPEGGVAMVTAPATEEAARWAGWGTALKPGQEMWWLARKPLSEGTVAANVLEHGTGAINIGACRVAHASEADRAESEGKNRHSDFASGPRQHQGVYVGQPAADRAQYDGSAGRWPTNIVLTHSAACEQVGERLTGGDRRSGQEPGTRPGGFGDVGASRGDGKPNGPLYGPQAVPVFACAPDCPVVELDRQSGTLRSGDVAGSVRHTDGGNGVTHGVMTGVIGRSFADTGGASRFYPVFRYEAKAPSSERPRLADGTAHPTVKSLGLIRFFVRMITPPGGTVADLFAGSGPVGEAAIIEGFNCVLIEQDPKSVELIRKRLSKDIQPDMFGGAA